ncbi:unnamed protein product, partial [Phaeothamnion confervicola]
MSPLLSYLMLLCARWSFVAVLLAVLLSGAISWIITIVAVQICKSILAKGVIAVPLSPGLKCTLHSISLRAVKFSILVDWVYSMGRRRPFHISVEGVRMAFVLSYGGPPSGGGVDGSARSPDDNGAGWHGRHSAAAAPPDFLRPLFRFLSTVLHWALNAGILPGVSISDVQVAVSDETSASGSQPCPVEELLPLVVALGSFDITVRAAVLPASAAAAAAAGGGGALIADGDSGGAFGERGDARMLPQRCVRLTLALRELPGWPLLRVGSETTMSILSAAVTADFPWPWEGDSVGSAASHGIPGGVAGDGSGDSDGEVPPLISISPPSHVTCRLGSLYLLAEEADLLQVAQWGAAAAKLSKRAPPSSPSRSLDAGGPKGGACKGVAEVARTLRRTAVALHAPYVRAELFRARGAGPV